MKTHKKVIVTNGLKQIVKVSKTKADIRNEIEKENDIYDLLADVSNALDDVIKSSNLQGPNIDKFIARNTNYKSIIGSIINANKK